MPLQCRLFTIPPSSRLEACLVSDTAHIVQVTRGEFVARIQTALNQLSAGAGRENFHLKVDGIYGPKTAAAVKAYKSAPQRRILGRGQQTADDIVGKLTLDSLDKEMEILENELPTFGGLISPDGFGSPHNHSMCPTPPRVSGNLANGHADHRGTPMNPKGPVLSVKGGPSRVNIFGEGETDYLNFRDFSSEAQFALGRPLTQTLAADSVSDVCLRSAPINSITQAEIKRLARPSLVGGCRLTYASNQGIFTLNTRPFLLSLGAVVAQGRIADPADPNNVNADLEAWVIEIRK